MILQQKAIMLKLKLLIMKQLLIKLQKQLQLK